MAFGRQNQPGFQISGDRLASVAGGAPAAQASAAPAASFSRPASIEPDLSRIRPRSTDETPEAQKRRLAAKSVNFTATIIARLIIIAALGKFGYDTYLMTGGFHRGIAAGLVAMTLDLGRVMLKAMEPGTK